MEFKQLLKQLRFEYNLSQEELAKKLELSKSTVAMYETGRRTPSASVYEALADIFNVDIDYLYLKSPIRQKIRFDISGNAHHLSNTCTAVKINVLGRVAAGIPISAVEEIIDTEEISEDMAAKGEYFGLLIKGDSMEPRICDGDVVIVRQQDDAESGEIVIAIVNGNDATCKRLLKYAGGISLISLNSKYEPITFSDKEILEKPVRIIGKVVELRGKL